MIEDDTVASDAALAATAAGAAAGAAQSARYRHYREGALLGRGGMGEVRAAEDAEIGRTVAIKRMRSQDPARHGWVRADPRGSSTWCWPDPGTTSRRRSRAWS